jgi:hypothetical protein
MPIAALILSVGVARPPFLIAQESVTPSSTLCSPAISARNSNGLWDIADNLVKQGHYVAAARAYYQTFRCDPGGSPINPLVRDYHQLAPFDAALREAAVGKFFVAATNLKQILTILPQFGEARFLMGIFQWSAGMHAEARATWRGTITAPYFTMPPDFNQTPFPVVDAKRFLHWSASHPD